MEKRTLCHWHVPCQPAWYLSSSETRLARLLGTPCRDWHPALGHATCCFTFCMLSSGISTSYMPPVAPPAETRPWHLPDFIVCDTAPASCCHHNLGLHLPGSLHLLLASGPIPKHLVLLVDHASVPPSLAPRKSTHLVHATAFYFLSLYVAWGGTAKR